MDGREGVDVDVGCMGVDLLDTIGHNFGENVFPRGRKECHRKIRRGETIGKCKKMYVLKLSLEDRLPKIL